MQKILVLLILFSKSILPQEHMATKAIQSIDDIRQKVTGLSMDNVFKKNLMLLR